MDQAGSRQCPLRMLCSMWEACYMPSALSHPGFPGACPASCPRIYLSERKGHLRAGHTSLLLTQGMPAYLHGPCSWWPSLPRGPAACYGPNSSKPSLSPLSPAGSGKSSGPELRHQAPGAGHSGIPARAALLPVGCPGRPEPAWAAGWRVASAPEPEWPGSGSWQCPGQASCLESPLTQPCNIQNVK